MENEKNKKSENEKNLSTTNNGKYTKGNKISTVKWTRIPVADPQNGRFVSVHQYFSHNLGYKILWEKPKY